MSTRADLNLPDLPAPPLTIADAAEFLGVSVATVRRRIRDGLLAAAKHGRVVRISRRDLDAFVRSARRWR